MVLKTEQYSINREFKAGIQTCNVRWCQKDSEVAGQRIDGVFAYTALETDTDKTIIAAIEAKITAHDGAKTE